MTIASRAWAGAVALALLAPVLAAAQPQRNPFAELFGRAPERTGEEFTAVQFRTSARAQGGQTIETGGGTPATVVPDGLSGRADTSLSAEYMRDRLRFVGLTAYNYQEFLTEPSFGVSGYSVSGRADMKATTRLALNAVGSFVHSPFFSQLWLTADEAGSMAPLDRAAIVLMPNDTVEGSVGITSNYSARSSLSLRATARDTKFETQPQLDSSSIGGRAEWRRGITRDLSVHAGYGRDELRSQGPEGELRYVNELIDFGVDYGRALALARRTLFSFGTQTSVVSDQETGRHFRLNGHMALEHRFQRTWVTRLSVRRGTEFLPGFREPVFSDSADASLVGYLAKRVFMSVAVNGGIGDVGFDDSREFTSYSGNAKLTVAMTRRLGVFTQYLVQPLPQCATTRVAVPGAARRAPRRRGWCRCLALSLRQGKGDP